MSGHPEELTAQWHEARAADLLRPDYDPAILDDLASDVPATKDAAGPPPLPNRQRVELARVHVELAKSIRLGNLTRAIEVAARNRDTRASRLNAILDARLRR